MTSSITISTFNVLHDLNRWVSPITQPSKRYSHIINHILSSPSNIYCLNEITASFWPKLLSKLSNKYPYFSQPMIKKREISVVIFSEWPLKILYQSESLVIAYTNGLIVVATHLVAMEEKYQKRDNQMGKIVERLKEARNLSLDKEIREAFERKNIVLLGDLNLHLINETLMVYKYEFYDVWLELEKEKAGYTWDPKNNSMIGWFLPFDNRRMRLDRILVKQNSRIKPKQISIDFSQKIPNTLTLFPSDHFGLTMTFSIQPQPYLPDHTPSLSLIPNHRITGFRTMKTIKRMVKVSMVIGIILIIIAVKYLFRLL